MLTSKNLFWTVNVVVVCRVTVLTAFFVFVVAAVVVIVLCLGNQIEHIGTGLAHLQYLHELSLAHNQLVSLEGLDGLPLRRLVVVLFLFVCVLFHLLGLKYQCFSA